MQFVVEYANALFEVAREDALLEEISAQLEMLRSCLRAHPDYIRLLSAHSMDADERIALADEAFKGRVHPWVLNFIRLLIRRCAMDKFCACADAYRVRFNEYFQIAEARVTSAAQLRKDQILQLKKRLEAMSGRRVILQDSIDTGLIGGMRVELEGTIYDNSIRTQLDGLRKKLNE